MKLGTSYLIKIKDWGRIYTKENKDKIEKMKKEEKELQLNEKKSFKMIKEWS